MGYLNKLEMPEGCPFSIEIIDDDSAENPRDWDNLGTMTCWHRRYSLGDKHSFADPQEFQLHLQHEYAGKCMVLPIYMYDHSGRAFSTSPFSCPWDSGQVGYIWASHTAIRKWYDVKRVTARIREQAIAALKEELKTFGQYMEGDVYGYRIVDAEGDELGSCYGYYGTESCAEAARDALKDLTARSTLLANIPVAEAGGRTV